jgi:16S rRNA (guanine966-N2)-methyltransferase
MRVIAGSARGRKFVAPTEKGVRPTGDRVRESMFDVLAHLDVIEGARVVDLFAGSGALGIEALSRGAAHVTFVESNRRVAATITANLDATGLGAHARLVVADAPGWCGTVTEDFDLALCDPPYAFDGWAELLECLPAQLIVCESNRELDVSPRFDQYRIYRYGTTLVTVATRAVGEDGDVQL